MQKSKLKGLFKESEKKLAIALEIAYRKTKRKVFARLLEELKKSKRQKKSKVINVDRLAKIVSKNKGKTFVVISKILGKGEFSVDYKPKIIAFNVSKTALQKLNEKADFYFINNYIEALKEEKNIMLVK